MDEIMKRIAKIATSSARSFNRVGNAPRSLLRRSNARHRRPPRPAFGTERAARWVTR